MNWQSRMAAPLTTLLDAFALIDDPRKARGVRHPYASILALTFLGLLCRQTDMAGLQRWAADHWRVLKAPLGFTRKKPPHATTISRAIAKFSLPQFRAAFAAWLTTLPQSRRTSPSPSMARPASRATTRTATRSICSTSSPMT